VALAATKRPPQVKDTKAVSLIELTDASAPARAAKPAQISSPATVKTVAVDGDAIADVDEFVSECVKKADGTVTGMKTLYGRYRTWAAGRGQQPAGTREFGNALEGFCRREGIEVVASKNVPMLKSVGMAA
jgi:hypothetical protein